MINKLGVAVFVIAMAQTTLVMLKILGCIDITWTRLLLPSLALIVVTTISTLLVFCIMTLLNILVLGDNDE